MMQVIGGCRRRIVQLVASTPSPLRLARTGEVLDLLRRGGAETTADLATEMGVARSTVTERLEVLFGGVGRAEAEFGGDFGAGRRCAGAFDGALHQVEDLLLAAGEFRGVEHDEAVLVHLGMG